MAFKLPELPYAYDDLEKVIDPRTMELHHQKHHAGYTRKLNEAVDEHDLGHLSIEQMLKNVSQYSDKLRNNSGGYYNHNLYWRIMSPDGGRFPDPEISKLWKAINRKFGTFERFRDDFRQAALGRFGSGWAWLCVDEPVGDLYITTTPNQDNPLMDTNSLNGLPILGLDVWEHAYYLKYQNRRAKYVDAFFEIINWREVEKQYNAARTRLALV